MARLTWVPAPTPDGIDRVLSEYRGELSLRRDLPVQRPGASGGAEIAVTVEWPRPSMHFARRERALRYAHPSWGTVPVVDLRAEHALTPIPAEALQAAAAALTEWHNALGECVDAPAVLRTSARVLWSIDDQAWAAVHLRPVDGAA
ncbi:MAG: hypothetical protein QM679_10100 [Patulibacter sp.]